MAQYASKDLTLLEGLKPVRRRPGTYVSGVRFRHLVWEILDDGMDEAMKGRASRSLAA